ncbi:MAG: hypothetical protein JW776_00715 [Candidatus Lokiarchaeota archaeon]|nr:hypothetical protein [Candidatus Lokiarchaeota archaeon]
MSKLIKIILRVGVGVVQAAISLVVVIALISAFTVVPNLANFIDTENAEFNIADPSNANISIPFNLDNSQGLYNFDNLSVHIEMDIFNLTDNYNVLNGTQEFQVLAKQNFTDTLVFGNESFSFDPNLIAGINLNPTAYNMSIFVDVSTRYALGLIPFRLNVSITMPLSGP